MSAAAPPAPSTPAAGAGEAERGEVDLQVDGAVALVTLNRPRKLNALTPAMTDALADAVAVIDANPDIRVAVLTGSGRAFSVGSDISILDTYPTPWAFGGRHDYGDILRSLRKPIVAAVNGYAFGGGLELSLACDIRLAAASASFAAPEIKLGWIGGSGQCALLVHSIGPGNAARMILTGDPVDAPTALSWHLVSEVVDDADLLETALELARRIAMRAPIAAQTAKVSLHAAHTVPLDAAIALERHLQTVCFATADAAEGRAAFAERREPVFRGR